MRRTPEGKEQKLAGKVAVVTGSTDGIGLAIAKRLCEEGASVMISSRHKANVDAALAQLRQQNLEAAGVVCHVGKEYDLHMLLEETVEEFGGIDILVSNAGLNPLDLRLLKTPEDTWNKILDINLKSSYFLCKEVVPHLEERGGGSIVLIGTTAAPCSYPPAGIPEFGSYNISNIALLAMMKTLNPELAPLNIRINCITPGGIRTRSWRDMVSRAVATL
nr:hypothetical protein BaRGS_031914 [Batillaria attramentaria]